MLGQRIKLTDGVTEGIILSEFTGDVIIMTDDKRLILRTAGRIESELFSFAQPEPVVTPHKPVINIAAINEELSPEVKEEEKKKTVALKRTIREVNKRAAE